MKKEHLMEFDIDTFIKFARRSTKFYKEFIEKFDSKEAIEISIKLAINIQDDKYYNIVDCCDLFKIIKDVGILYGIYENEEEFCKDNHISY